MWPVLYVSIATTHKPIANAIPTCDERGRRGAAAGGTRARRGARRSPVASADCERGASDAPLSCVCVCVCVFSVSSLLCDSARRRVAPPDALLWAPQRERPPPRCNTAVASRQRDRCALLARGLVSPVAFLPFLCPAAPSARASPARERTCLPPRWPQRRRPPTRPLQRGQSRWRRPLQRGQSRPQRGLSRRPAQGRKGGGGGEEGGGIRRRG